MVEAICHCVSLSIPYFILGKGSNCLFDDRGFNGMIIHNKIHFMTFDSFGNFHAGAGYSFSLLGIQTARKGWSGLEFASGIPGSVGGAVFMNAGANGSETCQCLESIDYIDENGSFQTLDARKLKFGYRYSEFQTMKGAIVGATFKLTPSEEARKKQIDIVNYRSRTQPYHEKSAGCIFRNPDCKHAGKLIESNQLKGIQIGGAKISEIHANFIVNTGNASSKDVIKLVQFIQETIKKNEGIELQNEVRYIPFLEESHD